MTKHGDEGTHFDDHAEVDPGDDHAREELRELTAAAASLALGVTSDLAPLPDALKVRIEADADHFFGVAGDATEAATRISRRWMAAACAGWIAAAASLLVAATGTWQPTRVAGEPSVRVGPGSWTSALKATDHPLAKGAKGKVMWDQAAQAGLLRIEGLAKVDPSEGVYQLWIFDARRDRRYPIDGGTFAIADAAKTTEISVRPALSAGKPSLFAITLEPPGGVVVSDRQRIMLTATYP